MSAPIIPPSHPVKSASDVYRDRREAMAVQKPLFIMSPQVSESLPWRTLSRLGNKLNRIEFFRFEVSSNLSNANMTLKYFPVVIGHR